MRASEPEPANSCVFCAIVAGEAPARIVAEDERAIAFLDIFPLTRGHALVIPKRHAANLMETPADDLFAATLLAQQLAAVSVAPPPGGLGADGVNLLQANGAIAFQTVFHFHIHVLPRYPGDGFRLAVDRRPGEDAVMDEVAGLYRRGFDG